MKKTTLTALIATATMLVACGQGRIDGSYWSPEPSDVPTINQNSIKEKHTNCSNRTVSDAQMVRSETSYVSDFNRDVVYYNPMLKRALPEGSIVIDKRDYENFLYALYMNSKNVIKVTKHPKKQGFLIIDFQICNN